MAASPPRSWTSAWSLAGLATLLAAAVLLLGYRDHGLWSNGEIAVLQRAQADLGAAITGLERAPPLSDLVRTRLLALTGDPAAIRLPGALAGALLVGLAVFLARRLGAAPRYAAIAGAFALAFPVLESQSRLALGNPLGELMATLAALLGASALAAPRPRSRLLGLAALAALALATFGAGLLFGALLPLLAVAIAWPHGPAPLNLSLGPSPSNLSPGPSPSNLSPGPSPSHLTPGPSPSHLSPGPSPSNLSPGPSPPSPSRWLAALLAVAILATAALIAAIAYQQTTGWVPALAAARDLVLSERPHTRPFTATFEELGDQLFPWLPLLVVGLLHPGRARWPALWLLTGLVLASVWSLRYGSVVLPLVVPAAVVCAAGLEHLLAATTARATRRLSLLILFAGCLIHAKDVRRTPSHVGAVVVKAKGEFGYPARELRARELLSGLAFLALLGLGLAVLTRRQTGDGRLARLQARLPEWLPAAIVLSVLLHHALRYGHDLLPRTSELQSLHRPLTRLAAWQRDGTFPGPLAIHRISDPGVDLYGPAPDGRHPLAARDNVITWLKGQEPAVALVRANELAPLFTNARQLGWPLYVLDASNRDTLLVANTLPPGTEDQNPIRQVVFDAPPALAHATLVRFEDYVEVVAWDWEQPVVRGRETTLQVVLKVLKPLPSGSKITFRLQKDRLSRINPLPHDLAENLYGCQYWRAGDYILHRYTTTVPLLEILPGAHEVIVGMRRGENNNYKISTPAEVDKPGEHGVLVRGGHEFAVVGEVQVW